MRRIVCCALCALLLLGLCPAVRAEEAMSIGSREELLRIADDPAGSYALTADIDMGGQSWTPLAFSGKLNGNGHTLYNLTVTEPGPDRTTTYDGNRKEYDTVFGGLFSVVKNAEIRDLNLVNEVITVETDEHCFLGGIAGYAEHSQISGCRVQTRSHLTLTSVNAGLGGLVGFSWESEMKDCTVDAELVFTDVNQDVLCEEFIGGGFASGSGRIENCAVRTRGFSEIYGYAHNGGLIGMYKGVQGSRYKSAVTNTTTDTEISFFEITPSRRAYCSPGIGEDHKREVYREKITTLHYAKHESKTPTRLAPETCETPQYVDAVTAGGCETWGYTTHTCSGCGYSYRDSYTPPEHAYVSTVTRAATCTESGEMTCRCRLCGVSYTEPVAALGHAYEETQTAPTCTEPGEKVFTCSRCADRYTEAIPAKGHVPGRWLRTKAPQVNVPGEDTCYCDVCGQAIETRPVEALPYVNAEGVRLNAEKLNLSVKDEAQLVASVSPADATEKTCSFVSDNEDVAQVTPNGAVRGVGPGTATVTAVSADGRASAACTVTVRYTAWQWVKHYILFGWLWA